MSTTNFLLKNFSSFKGLDLRSSDLNRPQEYSSELDNVDLTVTNALTKRKGYQWKSEGSGGYGLGLYKDVNTSTGAVTETVVSLDNNLHKLNEDSFNVTYSGSGTGLLFVELNTATSTLRVRVLEDSTQVYSQDIGLGLDESATVAVSTIISGINALSNFSASGGTDTTVPAAFLDLHNGTNLTTTATAVKYRTWSQVNSSTSNPFSTTMSNKNNSDFEGASFSNLNNILYITTGYDELYKYDGNSVYRAGMPAGGDADGSGDSGTAPSIADAASGSAFSASEYRYYMFLYKQIDNKGNIVEGIISPYSAEYNPSGTNDADVTVTNISSSSGFNTNCAIVNGAQNGVTTITVDSGHTLKVGDVAYFYDGNAGDYVTKSITAITSTSISFTGAVDVADNAVISANLRIAIYRTADLGSSGLTAASQTYKLVAEIPNDSIGSSTQTFTDSISDANLGAEYVTPVKLHGLPPKGRYVTAFRNQLFIAGDPENVNTCYYSDIDSPEYFPAGDNSFLVDGFDGNKIKGLGALNTAVIVFKDKSIQSVTGDIAEDSFRVDEISYGGIGTASNKSISKIENSLFFLSEEGVYNVTLEGVSPVGDIIKSEFTKFNVQFNPQKALAENWVDRTKYVLFMPVESTDGSSNKYANTDSVVYVFDYFRKAWFKWSNINAQGGMVFTDSELYFQSRRLDSNSSATETPLARFSNYGDLRDYSDHQSGISWTYKTHWESMGEPALFKKFLRLKVFSLYSDIIDGEATPYTLDISTEFNYVTPAELGSFTMDFSNGSSGWGNGSWGSFPWGDSALAEIKGKLKVIKSRAIRLIFTNDTPLENVIISGYELEAAVPYRPFIKE